MESRERKAAVVHHELMQGTWMAGMLHARGPGYMLESERIVHWREYFLSLDMRLIRMLAGYGRGPRAGLKAHRGFLRNSLPRA